MKYKFCQSQLYQENNHIKDVDIVTETNLIIWALFGTKLWFKPPMRAPHTRQLSSWLGRPH